MRGVNLTAAWGRLLTLARWGRVKLENRDISEISMGSRIYRLTSVCRDLDYQLFLFIGERLCMNANRRLRIRYSLRTDSRRVLKDSTSFRQQVFTSCTFLIFMREHATSKRKHVRDYVFVNQKTRNTILYSYASVEQEHGSKSKLRTGAVCRALRALSGWRRSFSDGDSLHRVWTGCAAHF